jgi:hypothetical protein
MKDLDISSLALISCALFLSPVISHITHPLLAEAGHDFSKTCDKSIKISHTRQAFETYSTTKFTTYLQNTTSSIISDM